MKPNTYLWAWGHTLLLSEEDNIGSCPWNRQIMYPSELIVTGSECAMKKILWPNGMPLRFLLHIRAGTGVLKNGPFLRSDGFCHSRLWLSGSRSTRRVRLTWKLPRRSLSPLALRYSGWRMPMKKFLTRQRLSDGRIRTFSVSSQISVSWDPSC